MTTPTVPTMLYRLSSTVNGFPHRGGLYDGVKLHWLVMERDNPFHPDYSKLIVDQSGDPYERYLVDELFTREEVDQFRPYLFRSIGDSIQLPIEDEEVELPLRSKTEDGATLLPMSAVSAGGDTDFYQIWKHEDYDLPFKVDGYYCIGDAELVSVRECDHQCRHHQRVDIWVAPPKWMKRTDPTDPWADSPPF